MKKWMPIVVTLIVFITCGCRKAEVPFQHTGYGLSLAEKQNLAAFDQPYSNWTFASEALWVQKGVTQHVCLGRGMGSIEWSYDVFVFDGAGRIVVADVLGAPGDGDPISVTSVSPLKIKFERRNGTTFLIGLSGSPEEGRRKLIKRGEFSRRMQAVYEAWKQSGDTNTDRLLEMYSAAYNAALTNTSK